MPIDAQRAWLTPETYDRARIELALLRMERAVGVHREHSDPDQRALRIRQLQELVATAAVGHEPPDDGVAEPGMVLTVHYEADDLFTSHCPHRSGEGSSCWSCHIGGRRV